MFQDVIVSTIFSKYSAKKWNAWVQISFIIDL